MRLERHAKDHQRGDGHQAAEECDRLRKPGTQDERGDEQAEPGTGNDDQHRIRQATGQPARQTGTSSGSSQPRPSSLLIWVAKTRESLSTVRGGPSAYTSPSAISNTRLAVRAAHST